MTSALRAWSRGLLAFAVLGLLSGLLLRVAPHLLTFLFFLATLAVLGFVVGRTVGRDGDSRGTSALLAAGAALVGGSLAIVLDVALPAVRVAPFGVDAPTLPGGLDWTAPAVGLAACALLAVLAALATKPQMEEPASLDPAQ